MTTQLVPQVRKWRAFTVLAVAYFMTEVAGDRAAWYTPAPLRRLQTRIGLTEAAPDPIH